MADFGLYMGLQRKSNIFETKAQNRQMEVGLMEKMDMRSQQKLQQQAESQAKIQEFYDIVNQLDVLKADEERVQSAEQTAKAGVIEGIMSFGGDVGKFMLGGGVGILADYRNNVLQSEEVKNAIYNKTNHAQWLDAQAKGLFVKDVGVDVPVMLPDGTKTTEHRKVSMDEAYKLLENNVITELPWDGAEQDIDIGPDFFQTLYKDPRNPYSMDTEVAPEDLYNALRSDGASDDQALKKMQSYETYLSKGGTPWRYKSGDFLRKAQIESQMKTQQMQRNMMRNQQGGSEKTKYLDIMNKVNTIPQNGSAPISAAEWKLLINPTALGLNYNSETGFYVPTKGGIVAYDMYQLGGNETPKEYDLSVFDSVNPVEYVNDPITGRPMLKMTVTYADDHRVADKLRPAGENSLGSPWYEDNIHLDNWKRTETNYWSRKDEVWEGTVFVPVDRWINPLTAPAYNKANNVRTDQLGYIPEIYTQEQSDFVNNSINMQDETIKWLMRETGRSYNDLSAAMYSGNQNVLYSDNKMEDPSNTAQGSGGR